MMKVNNKYIWALIIGGVAFMLIPTGISDVLNKAVRALSFVFGITMICLDAAEIRKAGFTTPSRWWALLPPVYIWKRGNRTKEGRSLFWVYIGSLALCIALAALMAFAQSFIASEASQPEPVEVEEPQPMPQTAVAPVAPAQGAVDEEMTQKDCDDALSVMANLNSRRNQGDNSPTTFHEKAAFAYAEACEKKGMIIPPEKDADKTEVIPPGGIIEGAAKPPAGAQTCDVVFMRDGKVTGREADYAEVVLNDGYFTYDAVHGNRGDSTGNNAFDANNGEGVFNPTNQLKLKTTETDGAQVFESRATVMIGDEQHKYVYAQRVKADGKQEFYVTDVTNKFAINMVNCNAE